MYDGVCVIQCHSVGMFRAKAQISAALQQLYGDDLKAVYDKSSGTAPFKAGLELVDGYLYRRPGFEAPGEITVHENGHAFYVDWESGQKTGFFLDQRDNRKAVGDLARGRRVLNLFCYTGGFSVYALSGGAERVCSVDSSRRAVEISPAGRRRERREAMRLSSTGIPGASPSMTAPISGPWLSPKSVTETDVPKVFFMVKLHNKESE